LAINNTKLCEIFKAAKSACMKYVYSRMEIVVPLQLAPQGAETVN
jgi:hypothetical protein